MASRKHIFTALASLTLALLVAACASAPYGDVQPTVDTGGAYVAMTMTAVVAQRAAADAALYQVAPTATAYARQTEAVQTATAQAATYAAATPTVAAQWTQGALAIQATQTAGARTAQAVAAQRQATATAEARTADAIAAQARETATTNALTIEARAVSVHGTATAIALQAARDAQCATETAVAPLVAATATAEARSEARANRERMRWLNDLAQVAFFGAVIAVCCLVILVAYQAAMKLIRRPVIVQAEPGVKTYFLQDQNQPSSVHNPDRQVVPAASTDQAALPPGVSLEAQLQVTTQAQAADALYALAQGQRNEEGKSRKPPATNLAAEVVKRAFAAMPFMATPVQVIVLPAFDRNTVIGQLGAPPVLADTVEGEWVRVIGEGE